MQTEQSGPETTATSAKSEANSHWEVLRVVLGVMYLLGVLTHVLLGVLAPENYPQCANQTLVRPYIDLWQSLSHRH
jgi:hypothetical protein